MTKAIFVCLFLSSASLSIHAHAEDQPSPDSAPIFPNNPQAEQGTGPSSPSGSSSLPPVGLRLSNKGPVQAIIAPSPATDSAIPAASGGMFSSSRPAQAVVSPSPATTDASTPAAGSGLFTYGSQTPGGAAQTPAAAVQSLDAPAQPSTAAAAAQALEAPAQTTEATAPAPDTSGQAPAADSGLMPAPEAVFSAGPVIGGGAGGTETVDPNLSTRQAAIECAMASIVEEAAQKRQHLRNPADAAYKSGLCTGKIQSFMLEAEATSPNCFPKIDLEEGIRMFVKWADAHPEEGQTLYLEGMRKAFEDGVPCLKK